MIHSKEVFTNHKPNIHIPSFLLQSLQQSKRAFKLYPEVLIGVTQIGLWYAVRTLDRTVLTVPPTPESSDLFMMSCATQCLCAVGFSHTIGLFLLCYMLLGREEKKTHWAASVLFLLQGWLGRALVRDPDPLEDPPGSACPEPSVLKTVSLGGKWGWGQSDAMQGPQQPGTEGLF